MADAETKLPAQSLSARAARSDPLLALFSLILAGARTQNLAAQDLPTASNAANIQFLDQHVQATPLPARSSARRDLDDS